VGAECDFGYPLEVSSSVYRIKDIGSLLESLEYKNPNSFEARLSECISQFQLSLPELICAPLSLTFCAPINKVQSEANNRAGEEFGLSAEHLAEKYAENLRLDVDAFQNFTPNACHQEVELKLKAVPTSIGPKVAVVIPCYNQAQYLREAVESVVAQTYPHWECFIVDDGSPDNTQEVARELMATYSKFPIFLVKKTNGGLSDARNYGIAASMAEFILPLDSDDKLEPQAIEVLLGALLKDPSYAIAYPNYRRFGADSIEVRCIPEREFLNPGRPENGLPYSSLYRRQVWEKAGGYNTNMTWGYEDWNFWLSAYANGFRARQVDQMLFCYRVKPGSMLTNALKHDAELKSQLVLNNSSLFDEASRAWANSIGGTKGSRKAPPQPSEVQIEKYSQVEAPIVSVIVPTFNRPELLQRALASIHAQTISSYEVIVVDDAGSVSAKEVCDKDNSGKVSYIRHAENKGLAASRNTGIRSAKGKYIAYLDDDDVYLPAHLELALKTLEAQKAEVVFTRASKVSYRKTATGLERGAVSSYEPVSYSRERLATSNFIPVLCVVHSRQLALEAGLFDETLARYEDWEFWIRLSEKSHFTAIDQVTAEVTWMQDGSTMTSAGREAFDWAEIKVLLKHRQGLKYSASTLTQIDRQLQQAFERLKKSAFAHLASGRRDHYQLFRSGSIADCQRVLTEHLPQSEKFAADILELLALLSVQAADFAGAKTSLRAALKSDSNRESVRLLLETLESEVSDVTSAQVGPKVSVIVPLYNALEYTKEMFRSFFAHTDANAYELIVVDNASTDGTREYLKTLPASAQIILNESNQNFAGACNIGASKARGQYLLFLNSDTVLQPEWLRPMTTILDSEPQVAIVGNKHIYPDSQKLHHAGICFNSEKMNSHYLVGVEKDDPRVQFRRDFQAVNGACFLVRRDLFNSLGGFDTSYKNGCEEVELCLKAKDRGFRVVYTPESVIFHHGQRSPGRGTHDDKNMALFMSRWADKIKPDVEILQSQDEAHLRMLRASQVEEQGKRRIAILSTFNQACGIAQHTQELRSVLTRAIENNSSFDPCVYVLAENTPHKMGVDSFWVRRCWNKNDKNFEVLKKELQDLKIGILHVQFQSGLLGNSAILELAKFAQGQSIKVFVTFHSSETDLPLCAALTNVSHGAFVHLEQSKVRIVSAGGAPDKIQVVGLGMRSKIEPLLSREQARAVCGIPVDLKLISSFGFLEPHKGVLETIEALPEILKSQHAAFMFLGVGHPANPQSGEYLNRCRAKAKELGIENRVVFADGYLAEKSVSQYLLASDVVVMNYQLNRNEASAAAAFALAHQRPLVCSAMPPFKPLTGCTMQTSQQIGLAAAIHAVLSNDQFAQYLVAEGIQYQQQNTFEQLAQSILRAYSNTGVERAETQEIGDKVIGVDGRTLTLRQSIQRGIGHYSFHHLNAMIEFRPGWKFKIFAEPREHSEDYSLLDKLSRHPNVEVHEISQVRSHKLDLFHILDPMNLMEGIDNPFHMTDGVKRTVVFYDLIPLCRRSEHFDTWRPSTRLGYMQRLKELPSRCENIFAISQHTARDLQEHAGVAPSQISVVLAGLNRSGAPLPGEEQIRRVVNKYQINQPYFLTVGALDSHKNFAAVGNSFLAAQEKTPMTLVIVGGMNDGAKRKIKETFDQKGVKNVVFTGYVPREELECLYSGARGLVYPSLYEGFGFPVLEAMASGCPVITSDVTSIPEVTGKAALMFPPNDIKGIAGAMVSLAQNDALRSELIAKGRAQAAQFTWEKVAQAICFKIEDLLRPSACHNKQQATATSPVVR
jgi:glycosyltransferase involved in cell wall biosynthesis